MKLIYGRAGTGKSEYVYKDIKKKIDEGVNNKIYIITPEQFSFTAEKRLLNELENDVSLQAEVLSFERMAYRVVAETIDNSIDRIENSGKAMIIFDALNKNKSNLNFLGSSIENIDTILTEITEFKKHKISTKIIEDGINNVKSKFLQLKLNDILLMYESLNNMIENKFIDENDLLMLLEKHIKESNLYNDAIFYIDGFAGFTKQEYSIIQILNEIASELFITICTDDLKVCKIPENDVFYDNKQTYQSLNKIFNISDEDKICLDKSYRFKNAELEHLEKNIYSVPYKIYDKDVHNINLFLAQNYYEEIVNVANNINHLVRKEHYKYNDIAIICNNIESYSALIKVIFDENEIPVFVDENKDITQNIIIKYVLSIIEIFSKSWSNDSVFNYLKTGILNIDNLYEIENYCNKWGIQGNEFYKDIWNFEKEGENYQKEQELIVKPLLTLQQKMKEHKNASEISRDLYEFIYENIKDIEDLKTEENVLAFNLVSDVLNEIIKIFKENKISFEDYLKLLKVGIMKKELKQIPNTQDQVIVGDVNRSKTHKVKIVFIIGVNDGAFPKANNVEGFFNNKDREILKESNLEIAKGTKEKSYEENFNIYSAFSTAEEKLYISYSSSDNDGKALRKSLIITKLKNIFPKLGEETKIEDTVSTRKVTFSTLLNNINNKEWIEVYNWYKENEPEKIDNAINGLLYSNVPKQINQENINKLYGNNLFTSVSKLESYMNCPFSYYLKYGLKISEKEKLEIKSIDTGSFMHEIIDNFFKYLNENNINTTNVSDEQIKEIVDLLVNEKLNIGSKFSLNSKFQILVQRLRRVVLISLKYILNTINQSNFEILGTEIEFSKEDGAKYQPIEMKLDNGKKVSIVGKIDRVDIAKLPDGNFIRIIDYKSSTHDIDLNKVIGGLQLQLITYVDAMCKNEKVEPAGALYFTLLEPKIAQRNVSREEIKQIIEENYRMNGLVLANVNVIKAMDNELESGKSNKIPVTINNSGDINYTRSNAITEEEFEDLQKYVVKLIKQISNEILSGKIEMKPYYNEKGKNTACQFCKYKSICQFNQKLKHNDYRYIANRGKDDAMEFIKNNS